MNKDKLVELTNQAIAELVYPKTELQKAYNYYNGIRDEELFNYLEQNFGIGNPTSVLFTPLIRKHIDALIGEYLGTPIKPKISCKDEKTISNITREKELTISREIAKTLLKNLKNKLLDFMESNDENKLVDPFVNSQLEKLVEDLDSNFVSKFEIASQNVIKYVMQSRQTDLITKLRILLLDLLNTGYTFFRAKPTPDGGNVAIEVLSPLNVFPDKNPESPYVKDSYRIVVRKWLTKSLILNTYGKDLDSEDINKLEDLWGQDKYFDSGLYVRSTASTMPTMGIEGGREILLPGQPSQKHVNRNYRLIPVYEVEWLDTDKDFKMLRYETVRIGESIYILKGKNEKVQRSISNPNYCSLSVNGVYFDNRNDEPFSLMLACVGLQDKYDLLNFYRDNLIATSGTVGDYIDMSLVPSELGVTFPERLQKYLAYKKQGVALIDTAQEGRMATGAAPMNTIFNGFDNTVKADAILAIQFAIDSLEQTVSSITGVFRERLNGIEARDAVTNIKIGQNNSFTISKQWYQHMDLVTDEILNDVLNCAKIVYKKGLTGTIILGDEFQKIFTALPEHFTLTDFDVHVVSSSDITKDLETVKQILPELVKSGIGIDVIFDVMCSQSLSEAKTIAKQAVKKAKEEQNQMGQLQLQLQEMQLQLQQAQQQLQQSQSKIEQLDELRLQIEQQKVQNDAQIEWFKAQTDRTFKSTQSSNDTRRTDIEEKLLYDGNPYNDDVKQLH